MTDIKQALENLLAVVNEDDYDGFFIRGEARHIIAEAKEALAENSIESKDFTCSISCNINNVSSYYVAAKYFLAELRNNEPKTIAVIDSNGNEFFVTLKE